MLRHMPPLSFTLPVVAQKALELTVPGPHGDRAVRLSNPDKVYFPERGITKRQVVEYYLAVAEPLLGVLRDRPTTLKRYVDGVTGEAFYQKRLPKNAPPYVETATIKFPSGRPADEVCPTEPAVIAWAANLGTFDFHPWPVRRPLVDNPDELRIDLDPQPGTDFDDAARVAPHVRELLAEHGLEGTPKTSGGRGIHVFVPIEPRWSFVDARRATIAFGRELERRMPAEVTMKWWKEERGQKIFIDYNQMARDRTIASAYSIRTNPRATVSAPLRWDEVADVHPNDFDVTTMPARFAEVGDLFAPLVAHATPRYSIESLLELAERQELEEGQGDLPYPPEYPKMPGEPKRVQPSKDRDRPR